MRESPLLLASLLFLVAGCATTPTGGKGAGGVTAASPDGTAAQVVPGNGVCMQGPPKAVPTDRDRGVDAFIAGSLREATDILSQRVKAEPSDLAAQALLVASKTRADIASKKNAAALEKLRV